MDNERVSYKQGAKVGAPVAPEGLPSARVDDVPRAEALKEKGAGAGIRNRNEASPKDAALEPS